MRVTAVYSFEREQKRDRYLDILRLRRRVFKDRLGWEVTTTGEFEMDRFDTLSPIYLAAHDAADRVVGCVRFLSCDGEPTMVQTTFRELLGGHEIAWGEEIYEGSRFCVDTELARESGANGLRVMTYVLFAGMVEWGLSHGAKRIVTVIDTRLERILARAGWPLERIAEPRRLGVTDAVAGYLEVSEAAGRRIRERVSLTGPVFDGEQNEYDEGRFWREEAARKATLHPTSSTTH